MKVQYILLTIYLVIISCKRDNSQSIPTIDMEGVIANVKEMNFTDFFDTINYLKLDCSRSPIGSINKVAINDKYIVIYDRNSHRIFQFNRHGEYLRDLMKFGKGPNEFSDVTNLDINTNNEVLVFKEHTTITGLSETGDPLFSFQNESYPSSAKWLTDEIILLLFTYLFLSGITDMKFNS